VGAVKDTAGATNPTPFSTTFSPVDLAPGAVSGLTAAASNTSATVRWSLPDITDLDQVIVRSATGTTPPASPTSGTAVYAGTGTAATATGLAGTNTFRVWVKDRAGRLSAPADIRIAGGRLTTTVSPTTLTYGGTTTVTGKLVRSDTGAAVAGATVQLLAGQKGTTTWRLLGTRTTSSTGVASVAHKPAAGQDYQWTYAGTSSLLGARSALASVGVRPIVTASVSASSIRLGGSVLIGGGVTPAHPSQVVYLQRYVSGKWVGVATGRLSPRSTYLFTIKPSARGTYAYRVARPADVDHLVTTSVMRTFTVS
jgi:hypothetical protein